MKKLIAAALLLAAIAFLYFRPLTVYLGARRLYLLAIGVRHADVSVAGHRIHCLVAGEGPPLILVHGVAMRAEDWAPYFRALSRDHRVYAIDLLGYGDSDKPRDSLYTVGVQTDIVRGVVDVLGVKQADVVGVSMGGWISLQLAATHPERVRRLVLISSAGLAYGTTLTETSFSATTLDEQRDSFKLQSDLAPQLPDFILRDFLRRSKRKAWIVRASMRSMLHSREVLDGKLQRVRMPVLLVAGTADRIVPFHVALRMKQELPHATLVPLRGCGHLAAYECRAETLAAVTRFLR